jgi:glycosyltransferase involved in cell wall biosynthesis
MRSNQAAMLRTFSEPRRRRICFVGLPNLAVLAPEFDRSGASGEPVQQTLLAKALARRGYDISMVTADRGQPDGATWHGVRTFKAFAPQAGLPLLRFVHPRWTGLWSALSRADADVYYSSCAGGLAGQVAMFCAWRSRRYVFRVASDSDCMPDALIIRRWYWRDKRLYEYALKQADGVLAQSVRQQELLLHNFGRQSSLAHMLVGASGTNLDFGRRDIHALWVSNIRRLKRPDILLDIAAELPRVPFHIVGGPVAGERELFDEAQGRARAAPNVRFDGPLAYDDAAALYGRARVFVNTSDMEGFPNTYLQAWASGTPVVAFFDPDGLIAEHGLGIAVRSREEMIAAVRTLSQDEAAWNAARARCLAFIEQRYGEDVVLQQYLRVLDPSCAGQPGIRS